MFLAIIEYQLKEIKLYLCNKMHTFSLGKGDILFHIYISKCVTESERNPRNTHFCWLLGN